MMDTFSLSEVLQMAEEIERSGVRFYKQGAQASTDPETKKVMLDLAEKEKEHEKTFAELRRQYCSNEDLNLVDLDGQVAMHIRLMAETHVFNLDHETSQLVASVQSPRSLLKLALGFEKDTIVFFSALKDAVTDKNREKVDILIQEEIEHIRQLSQAIKQLR